MKESTLKNIKGFGYFMGAAAYGFVYSPVNLVREFKKRREREKIKKGLDAWYEFIKRIEESGEYTEQELHNISCWFAEGCLQYAKMF